MAAGPSTLSFGCDRSARRGGHSSPKKSAGKKNFASLQRRPRAQTQAPGVRRNGLVQFPGSRYPPSGTNFFMALKRFSRCFFADSNPGTKAHGSRDRRRRTTGAVDDGTGGLRRQPRAILTASLRYAEEGPTKCGPSVICEDGTAVT